MRRGWDYKSNHQKGQETTSPGDYHEHLSKMIRTPSILPDVPHYPNVHKAFNKSKVTSNEETDADEGKQPKSPKSHSHHKASKHSPQFQEKVEVIEFKEEVKTAPSGGSGEEKAEVYGESVDSKADGYIQRRHQKFELCKWATFKVH